MLEIAMTEEMTAMYFANLRGWMTFTATTPMRE
jgi:hypothetical protein